jgi:capsular exopolysaccharide synthesis family protein
MEQNFPQSSIDLRGLYLMMRRRVKLLGFGAGLGVVLALATVLLLRPQYTATTVLMVDSREEKVLNDAVVSALRPSQPAIASEAAVIIAPSVLKRVVEKLALAKDPEFEVSPPATSMLATVRAQLFTLFGTRQTKPHTGEGMSDELIELIESLRKSIEVTQSQYTNLLHVSVSSKEPWKAARLANAVADAYLVQQIEGRYDATRRATEWLKERLEEQRVKLRRSEERFEHLKGEMEVVDKEGATLEDKQLMRLNEELIMARAKTAEAQAKYAALRQQGGAGMDEKQLGELVQSALITQLRTQLAQVIREEDSLGSRFGRNHPLVVKVLAEKQGLNSQIDDEVRRIALTLKSELDVAKSREESLEASLKAASLKATSQKSEYVELRELQREAESDKALYESMLQRMKQATAQETWKATDFRVVAEAVPPLSSNRPKTKLLALAALSLGFGIGIGLTLLTELLDKTFKRGRDVEAKLSVPHLVDVPLLPAATGGLGRKQYAFQFSTLNVGSPFADAMLGLHSGLQSVGRDTPIRTVMFTSATPGEGKSVIAANFAQTAARSGFKVLLICTDLRTPTTDWLARTGAPRVDLVDYLNGKAEIEATVVRSEEAGIDLVPAARSAPNAASLLASPRMQKLLDWGRANYDLVVIDTVAVGTCLDGRMLARHVDATVVVIEWLKTTVEEAKEAVDLLLKNDARIAGAVLNKVDFAKARLYGISTSA